MSTNIRAPKQLRGGARFTRELESDAHYNDLLNNELLTKAEFPSGVHEVISDPTSNTNPTREFYQLSILSGSTSAGELLIIVDDAFPPAIADITQLAAGLSADAVAGLVRTSIDSLHGGDVTPRFVGIDLSFNVINFSTERRGNPNDHVIQGIDPATGSYIAPPDANTGVRWRIDIISAASNSGENTEIILDAGIWTGV